MEWASCSFRFRSRFLTLVRLSHPSGQLHLFTVGRLSQTTLGYSLWTQGFTSNYPFSGYLFYCSHGSRNSGYDIFSLLKWVTFYLCLRAFILITRLSGLATGFETLLLGIRLFALKELPRFTVGIGEMILSGFSGMKIDYAFAVEM